MDKTKEYKETKGMSVQITDKDVGMAIKKEKEGVSCIMSGPAQELLVIAGIQIRELAKQLGVSIIELLSHLAVIGYSK